MNYESWVPSDAVSAWEIFLKDGLTQYSSIFGADIPEEKIYPDSRPEFKLMKLKRERTKLALVRLPRLFTRFTNGSEPQRLWAKVTEFEEFGAWEFMCTVSSSFTGPDFSTELMTATERNGWKNKTIKKASELRALVGSGSVNNIMDSRYFELQKTVLSVLESGGVKVEKDLKAAINHCFSDSPLLTTILNEVEQSDSFCWNSWHELYFDKVTIEVLQKKPNDPDAHRYYFICKMTNFFGSKTGTPQRALTKLIVDCLFEDPNGGINERMINKIAPWPVR